MLTRGVGVLVLAAVCAVIVAPIVVTAISSFWSADFIQLPGSVSLSNFEGVLTASGAFVRLRNTLIYALGATCVSLVVGGSIAVIVTRINLPFARVLRLLPFISLLLPGLLRDVAWIELYAPGSGLVNIWLNHLGIHGSVFNIFGMPGMVLSEGLTGAAIPYIILLGPLGSMDPALEEASRSCGASVLGTIRRVTLPVLRPALMSAFALTMVLVASEFETPILIGRPGGVLTYISELYSSIGSASAPDYDLASAQAIVYLVLTGILLALYIRSTRQESRFVLISGRGQSRDTYDVGWWRWALAAVVVLEFLLSAGQLIFATVMTSLVPYYTVTEGDPFKVLSFTNYHTVLSSSSVVTAIGNSVELGVIVAILSTAIGVGLAFVSLKTRWRGRRVVEAVATLPIGLPPVVFSAAILITVISVPGLSQFYGTIVPVIIADVVVTLPFAMRVLSGALITVQNDLLEASSASGAGLSRTLRSVLVPLLLPAIANSAVFVFVRSFLQLGAIVFLVTPGYNLLPTEIFNYWGTGSYGAVDALNVISVVIPLVVLLVVFTAREAVRRVPRRRRDAAPAYAALANAQMAGDTP